MSSCLPRVASDFTQHLKVAFFISGSLSALRQKTRNLQLAISSLADVLGRISCTILATLACDHQCVCELRFRGKEAIAAERIRNAAANQVSQARFGQQTHLSLPNANLS